MLWKEQKYSAFPTKLFQPKLAQLDITFLENVNCNLICCNTPTQRGGLFSTDWLVDQTNCRALPLERPQRLNF